MNFDLNDPGSLNVTIMGLGLHGGGLASAVYFAARGANVVVTDLRDEQVLRPSLKALERYPIRFVLGRHEDRDFKDADILVKNPGVPRSSPFLDHAKHIETDISIFLKITNPRIIAVTGSKGKSTISSAVYHVLHQIDGRSRLCGNITVSPLSFFTDPDTGTIHSPHDVIPADTPVVMELSSWQLADLHNSGVLCPEVAIISNILHDHQNRYSGLEEYAADKAVIFENQTPEHILFLNYDDPFGSKFAEHADARIGFISSKTLPNGIEGGWLEGRRGFLRLHKTAVKSATHDGTAAPALPIEILPDGPELPGVHTRKNLLFAACGLSAFGISPKEIMRTLGTFPGVAHRLEFVGEIDGRFFYNDSTATIPDAVVAAVDSFSRPVRLIAGGTDKALDFEEFGRRLPATRGIYLLAGSATVKIEPVLARSGVSYQGPFDSLPKAVEQAFSDSESGDIILLSPGCASFEMFLNEFDRGNRFTALVHALSEGRKSSAR